MNSKSKRTSFALIEIVVIVTILWLIADLFIRIYFREEIVQWEGRLHVTLGLDPFWTNTIMGVLFVSYVFCRAAKQSKRIKARREEANQKIKADEIS